MSESININEIQSDEAQKYKETIRKKLFFKTHGINIQKQKS